MSLQPHTPESDFLSPDEIMLNNVFWILKGWGESTAHPNYGAAGAHFPGRWRVCTRFLDPLTLALTAPTHEEPFSYQKVVRAVFFDLQLPRYEEEYTYIFRNLRSRVLTPDLYVNRYQERGWSKIIVSDGLLRCMLRGWKRVPPEEYFAGEFSRLDSLLRRNSEQAYLNHRMGDYTEHFLVEVMAEVLRRHTDLRDRVFSRARVLLEQEPVTRTEALAQPPQPLPANYREALIELLAIWHATTVYVDGVYRRYFDEAIETHGDEIAAAYRDLKREISRDTIDDLTPELRESFRTVLGIHARTLAELKEKDLLLEYLDREEDGACVPSRFGAFSRGLVDTLHTLNGAATFFGCLS